MKLPRFVSLIALPAVLVAMCLSNCGTFDKKKDKDKEKDKLKEKNIADQNSDVAFQSFMTRLRKAVDKHDIAVLSSLMSADFGYSWSPGGEGPGVFQYWTANKLWPEVSSILRQHFVPNESYMVAPPQVTYDTKYQGYRAGLRLVNGSWRFCYFVPAPPAGAADEEPKQ